MSEAVAAQDDPLEAPTQPLAPGKKVPRWAVVLLICLIVGLRIVALSSDAYTRLDWSAGILTDEGFYAHNARNVALFGHPRTDQFNNMLLSPLLHFTQVAVFKTFGVGMVQARLISVVCSLLALLIFYAALKRLFDNRIALTAVLFLGLDHTNLLYNRLALMDTPATLPAIAAFYAFVRGLQSEEKRSRMGWMAACGILLGLTVVGRMLCAYLLPVPFIALAMGLGARGKARVKTNDEKRSTNDHRPTNNDDNLVQPRGTRGSRGDNNDERRTTNDESTEWKDGSPSPIARTALSSERNWERGTGGEGLPQNETAQYYKPGMTVFLSLLSVAVLYIILWYLPNRAEIAPMNHYYRTHQIQPRSVGHLLQNIQHAVVGDFRGLSPYLFRHTPILFIFAILGVFVVRRSSLVVGQQAGLIYLTAWLLLGWLVLAVISYSPSRYYVSTYPAMAALAAIGLWSLPETLARLREARWPARILAGLFAGFIAFHAMLALVHYDSVLSQPMTNLVLYGLPVLVFAVVVGRWSLVVGRLSAAGRGLIAVPLALWLICNAFWLTDWARHINYSQIEMSRWLGDNLPPDSVLIGDVSPGLSMNNKFMAIHVQPGLANDKQPVEQFTGRPRYIVVLDGRWKEQYWMHNYPELITENHRVKSARVLRWDIGVYAVEQKEGLSH